MKTGTEKGKGSEVKCHPTREQATAHLRALYANVPDAEWAGELEALEAAFAAEHPFGEETVQVAGEELRVWVASTLEQKTRGMVARQFPEDIAGLLFEYLIDTSVEFHMHGVPTSLAVAFFDSGGQLVGRLIAPPGTERIRSPQPFRYVLELPVTKAELLARPECTLVR